WGVRSLPRRWAMAGARVVRLRDVARAPVLVACLLAFVANAGIFAIWLLAPFSLLGMRGLPPMVAGAVFMLTPLSMTMAAPLAGRLSDLGGGRALIAGGLLLEAVGLWLIGEMGPATPVAALAFTFAVAGLGLGLFQVPNMAIVMATFGTGQQGVAGGLA